MALRLKDSVGRYATNHARDVIAVKARLLELGFCWLRLDGLMDTKTQNAIRLFQAIISGETHFDEEGRIEVADNTHRWLNAVNAPRWQVLPLGSRVEGFDNVDLFQLYDDRDYATDWLVTTLRCAAAHYAATCHATAMPIIVRDATRREGGDTALESDHQTGLSCDIAPPRLDGKTGSITHTSTVYDRTAMRAMLQALQMQALTAQIYFNDPVLIAEACCQSAAGHDQRVRLEIQPPVREDDPRLDAIYKRQ